MTSEKIISKSGAKVVAKPSKKTFWEKVEITLNAINHMFIASISIYMTFLCLGLGYRPITLHIFLCTIGVSILT